MRLGGFVIHSNAAPTIGPCLDSLAAACDELVAVDTGASDGTAALAEARGFTVHRRPWEGYGAARAEAVAALRGCDWVFFLDSDEWLEPDAIEALRRFKAGPEPLEPCVALPRRNWAELGGRRFVYHHEHPVRLARRAHARFDRRHIVHETVPPGPTVRLAATIDHLNFTDLEAAKRKVGRYALLWALRHHAGPKAARSPALQWAVHLVRDLGLRGAGFSWRPEAFQLAAVMAGYHAAKYELLRAVRAGEHCDLARLLAEGRLEELFRSLPPEGEPRVASWLDRAIARLARAA